MARDNFRSTTGATPADKGGSKRIDPTMAPYYHELLKALINRGHQFNFNLDKSVVVRAALVALWEMEDEEFKESIESLFRSEGRTP